MARQTAAERDHEAELAARRKRYAAAKKESEMDYNKDATISRDMEVEAPEATNERPWVLPNADKGPPAHAVVEIETGGDICKGRHIGGVWKTVDDKGVDSVQAVHITRWRFIGKKVV